MSSISPERIKEILKGLRDAVYCFEEDDAVKWSNTALKEGLDPILAIMEGLAAGMTRASDSYLAKQYFLPQLLGCSDALYAGLALLKPAVLASGRKTTTKGSLVIGVVEGDVHDIGKNLIKVMFDAAGWEVYDLGRDVPLEKFVEEQIRTNSKMVALSAMMTTTMRLMPVVIKKLKEKNPDILTMVGGAPLNLAIAEKYGADGYTDNAGTVIDEANGLIEMLEGKEACK